MLPVFSSTDLPAIAAAVLPRRAARSSLHALAWALLFFVPSTITLILFWPHPSSGWLGPVTSFLPVIVSGAILLVAAAGLVLRKLWTILASAAAVGSIALLAGIALLQDSLNPARAGPVNSGVGLLILFPLIVCVAEVVRYGQLKRLLSSAEIDPAVVREKVKQLFAFVKSGESYEDGRIRVVVEDGHGRMTSGFFRPPYVGQLMSDGMLLISERRSDFFWFPRNAVLAAGGRGNALAVQVAGRKLTLRLMPASLVAVKRWLLLPVTDADVRLCLSRKCRSAALLQLLAGAASPAVRGRVVRAMEKLGVDTTIGTLPSSRTAGTR